MASKHKEGGVKRLIGDTDLIRRQNRALVLETLRRSGPLSRVGLAAATGLSNATISAISSDMLAQNLLIDLPEPRAEAKARGRPPVRIGFNQQAGYACVIEVDVNRCRCSLVDYGGTLSDRVEKPTAVDTFREHDAAGVLRAMIEELLQRNPGARAKLFRIAVSVQGMLDRGGRTLIWSPVAGLSGTAFVDELQARLHIPVAVYKRGQLLAEGTRTIYPELRNASVATVFVGSTVGMGISLPGDATDVGTDFGHMNHIPDGALCRCGTRGCVEAYAADYGVLRTAFGVKPHAAPAPSVPPSEYHSLIQRARKGDRNAIHAFNLAGRAIGFGLSRLLTIVDFAHVVIVGPGADATELMRPEISAALNGSIVVQAKGPPDIRPHRDESEPVFRGLVAEALGDLDRTDFAALPAPGGR